MDKKNNIINVFTLTETHLTSVVSIHEDAFRGYLNTKLGKSYIYTFYKWFVDAENSIALVAIDDEQIACGYVVGAPLGYEKEINRRLLRPALLGLLSNFRLLIDSHFLKVVFTRLNPYRSRSSNIPDLPYPVISLVGIGVSTSARGKKIGEILMRTFEENAVSVGMKAMRLSVYPDNNAARRLYEKMDWLLYDQGTDRHKAIYYYKLIN